jgi:WD40 repeat protein
MVTTRSTCAALHVVHVFAHDSRLLVSSLPSKEPGGAHLLEPTPNAQEWRKIGVHQGGISSATYCVELRLFIIGSYIGTVHTWSLERGELVRTLDGHTSAVHCVTVHGHMLV